MATQFISVNISPDLVVGIATMLDGMKPNFTKTPIGLILDIEDDSVVGTFIEYDNPEKVNWSIASLITTNNLINQVNQSINKSGGCDFKAHSLIGEVCHMDVLDGKVCSDPIRNIQLKIDNSVVKEVHFEY